MNLSNLTYGKYLRLYIFAALALSACNTTRKDPTSETKYANAPTDLTTIAARTCVNYQKVDKCLLRLQDYKADAAVLSSAEAHLKSLEIEIKDAGESSKFLGERGIKDPIDKIEVSSIQYYTIDGYAEMNKALRGNDEYWKSKKDVIFAAASGLNALSSLVFKGDVSRTENTDVEKAPQILETYKVGNIIVEETFLSTSRNFNLNFAVPELKRLNLNYTIKSKSGVYVRNLSDVPSEEEVLFLPGTVFRVTAFEQTFEEIPVYEYDPKTRKKHLKETISLPRFHITMEEIDPINP